MDKVLIVDDSDFDRRMLRKAISAACPGISVLELDRGDHVRDMILREAPDLTLLDIRIPGQDGFEILSSIRADRRLSDHKVLMISGSAERLDRDMAARSGANGYFVKPPTASGYFSLGADICQRYLHHD